MTANNSKRLVTHPLVPVVVLAAAPFAVARVGRWPQRPAEVAAWLADGGPGAPIVDLAAVGLLLAATRLALALVLLCLGAWPTAAGRRCRQAAYRLAPALVVVLGAPTPAVADAGADPGPFDRAAPKVTVATAPRDPPATAPGGLPAPAARPPERPAPSARRASGGVPDDGASVGQPDRAPGRSPDAAGTDPASSPDQAPSWSPDAPQGSAPADRAVPDGAAGRSPDAAGGNRIVVVRPGDTLWSIAAESLPDGAAASAVATAWPHWWQANRAAVGPDPDLIHPGLRLHPP